MKKNLFYSLCTAVTLLLCSLPVNGATPDEIVSVDLLNQVYYGTLTTENDESTFTTLPSSDVIFSITGNWSEEEDAFDGKCIISYEDGTTQSVKYKNGLVYKNVTTTYPDGTYQIFSVNDGKPCKKIKTYSKNNTLTSLDWFHRCKLVTELTDTAISVDYEELLENPYDYVELPIKVSGTVTDIYEGASNGYMKIKDSKNNLYLFYYPNASISSFTSSNIENVLVGDSIEIYGFYDTLNDYEENPLSLYEHSLGYEMGSESLDELITDADFLASIKSYSEINDPDLEKVFPIFDAFYWKTNETDINPVKLTFNYKEICKYPYYYKDEKLSITGKVVYENINVSNNRVVLLIQDKESSEIYGATYKTDGYTSLLGKTVSCSGSGNGNCKIPYYNSESRIMGYALYPNIKVSKLSSLSD